MWTTVQWVFKLLFLSGNFQSRDEIDFGNAFNSAATLRHNNRQAALFLYSLLAFYLIVHGCHKIFISSLFFNQSPFTIILYYFEIIIPTHKKSKKVKSVISCIPHLYIYI